MCKFSETIKRDFFSDEETLRCDREHGLDADTLCIIHSLNPDKSLDDFAHEVKRSIQSASKKNSDGKQILQVKLAGAQVPKGFRWADLDIASEQTQNIQLDLTISHFFADADFSKSQWQSILCQQANIAGNTSFSHASIGGSASFSDASIGGDADFRQASIGGSADFRQASIGGSASFSDASIGGDADFRQASIGGSASFSDASIGGDADFRQASIGGSADFRQASIGGDADFRQASIGGDAYFRQASIGRDASFSDASIGGDAYFSDASIGGDAYFSDASIGGDASFSDASIGGDASFRQASIGGDASFRQASIGGFASFRQASIGGSASFRQASIGGYAYFSDASIGGYASFSNASVGGYASFSDASIGGFADFIQASIGGYASFSDASIGGSASFRQASIGGYAYFSDASIGGYASFSNASIGGYASFSDASIGGYASFRQASIGGYASFSDASIGGSASFSDASIGRDADFHNLICMGQCTLSGLSATSVTLSDMLVSQLNANQPLVELHIHRSIVPGVNINAADSHGIRLTNCLPYSLYKSQRLDNNDDQSLLLKSWQKLLRQRDIYNFLLDCLPKPEAEEKEQTDEEAETFTLTKLLTTIQDKLKSWKKILLQTKIHGFLFGYLPEEEKGKEEETEKETDEEAETFTLTKLLATIQNKALEHSLADSDSELAQSIQNLHPPNDARQKGITRLIRICPAITTLLLQASSTKKEVQGVQAVRESITKHRARIETFIDQEKEPTQFWDLQSRDLSQISFIECDLSRADFSSSNVANTYFDSCKWNKPSKRGYDALYQHDELLSKKTNQQNSKLEKLRNVYQRLKKNFEENHDYRQAGQFHYREMQIRQKILHWYNYDLYMLCLYRWVASYGENYLKVILWLFGVVGLSPVLALISLTDTLPKNSLDVLKAYGYSFGYYLFAVVPRSIGNTFGTQLTQLKGESEKVDLGSLQWLLQGLEIQSPGLLGESLLRGSVVLFYITFFILLALLIMSVRRRYKR